MDAGTLEFKAIGEVIVVDNMSATLMGHYKVEGNNMIKFELTATDILRDSVQTITKQVITAKIIKLSVDELQLRIAEENELEHYRRVR